MSSFEWINILWIGVALLTCFILLAFKVRAPYGRHIRSGWGPTVSNKWGWFIMELPALVIMPILVLTSNGPKSQLTWLLTFLWALHYANRTLIFPFKIKTQGKKMPITIMASAFFFNCINGGLNGYYLGYLAPENQPVFNTHVMVGLALFVIGLYINKKSDSELITLRNEESGYQIPKNGLFKYVSCPNHLGEILEWIGFALIAWNIAALSFAVWTICNLLPRALNHHAWYRKTFENYPKNRKALIPFIL